ncbi:MAG: MCP four helix bundle domain-containing protein [Desulfobacterales bacterium]|nr:MAG: MCP four helix bundle domain-containing protein [Desulfobacterales bacterium]
MNVKSKLLLNAGISILCVLVVGLTGYFFTNKVAEVSLSLLKNQAQPILRINEVEKTAQMIFSRLVVHNSTSDSDVMGKIEEEITALNGQLDRQIKEYQKIAGGGEASEADAENSSQASATWLQNFQTKWNRFSQFAQEILELSQNFNKEDALSLTVADGKAAYDEALAVLHDKIKFHDQQMTVLSDDALAARGSALLVIVVLAAVALGIAVGGGLLISHSITKPLNRAIEGLTAGADQVALASGQVSSSSQELAEGSSQQAASIEETSSSLEEMSSMTRQNADNASQADNLMKEANQIVAQADESMSELTRSMQEISQASEETSKIIKTIDEIAFQTNLLALNAAVEAARAGEAGAGFAVVADEVRNLAMRAADAARDTAQLIEGTVKKVGDGSELVTRTNAAFSRVADSTAKVGELVGEIAAASSEQAQGIRQVNTAVSEMDKVTQSNAASAEESASAAEEMTAQAEEMKVMVNELIALVGGKEVRDGNGRRQLENSAEIAANRDASFSEKELEEQTGIALQSEEKDEIRPANIIPPGDEDLRDF